MFQLLNLYKVFKNFSYKYAVFTPSTDMVIECTEPFFYVCDKLPEYRSFVVPVAHGKVKEIKEQYLVYQMEGE
ncbi:MAG TPA: hypothetical protein DDZ89_11135 [Clostridiales bacterium]|nr:hypothetical protein [Clostridiales bacterium]